MENKIKICTREELKEYFKNGMIPTEQHFEHLIDSSFNMKDDGLSKSEEDGYQISAVNNKNRLITFYENNDFLTPFFLVEKDLEISSSLKFQSSVIKNEEGKDDLNNVFFLHTNGNLGLGKHSEDNLKLDVNGIIGSKGRIGTYKYGAVCANGEWHTIVEGLDDCQAFEVMARTGKKGSGKFSIMHAIALSTYGNNRYKNKIKKTHAYYGFFWNKINLRWTGTTHNYSLQIKTNRNYGENVFIYYNISKLWDDELIIDDNPFYKKVICKEEKKEK